MRRPLRVRLDRRTFERLVVQACAPDAQGRAPTVEEAQARVSAALARFVR